MSDAKIFITRHVAITDRAAVSWWSKARQATHRLPLLGYAHADAVRNGHLPERRQELRLPRAQLDLPHPHRRLHLGDVIWDGDLQLPLRRGRANTTMKSAIRFAAESRFMLLLHEVQIASMAHTGIMPPTD